MNPKCPWCGSELEIVQTECKTRWLFTCRHVGCHGDLLFKTKKEALAAASKRFMPKRSVEEINEYELKAIKMWSDELCKQPSPVTDKCMNYLDAVKATRIADFIYGVNE